MKPVKYFATLIAACFLLFSISSCNTNPLSKIQGIYKFDKASLKKMFEEKAGKENAFAAALLDKVIENAIIEFKISGDSIKGLMFVAGETTLLNSKVELRNDSMVIKIDDRERYLIPTSKGFLLKNTAAAIEMIKSDQSDLSKETLQAIAAQAEVEKKLKVFKDNLGKWQKGNYVDDFGDSTGEDYVYTIVPGTHQTSSTRENDMYVKTIVEKEELQFSIYNETMTVRETFPRNEFGYIKVKLPDGEVKNERVFFGENSILESPLTKGESIYNYLQKYDGELKVMVDASTANEYFSDKYQFSIQRNNLNDLVSHEKAN